MRALCFPADIPGWLIVLFLWLCWGFDLKLRGGIMMAEFKENSWPMRTWYRGWGGTTFGHAMIFAAGFDPLGPLPYHELVHVEQFEAMTLAGYVPGVALALSIHPLAGLAMVVLFGFVAMLAAMAAAWLRGEKPYRGSVMEEAAYDATELRGPQS